ncbi:prepilin-type N-terminal cleavage/methylation domain-containing protein [Actinotalea sp. JY-7885]|uniref:prepilin-type N-terminal cleavage/methylation domain-containing protein n=1 Tax=Actinotalea sp. JY-7885 TaxID=2758576 RepID=UPI00165DA0F2|nr:prepilin-type N-terminal cleavage/methylation domain-containing protein [Actinotalea sp. JY-7885]
MIPTHRPRPRSSLRGDAGITLIEVLVAVVLAGILAGVGLTLVRGATVHQDEVTRRADVWNQFRATSGILNRDVTDATSVRVAEPDALTLAVVRDGACQLRAYAVTPDRTLDVTTTYFEREACSGASEASTKTLIDLITGTENFLYFNATDREIPSPVEHRRNIKRIEWDLHAQHEQWTEDIDVRSAAAFNGIGEAFGTGVEVIQAQAPSLSLDYSGFVEGVGNPVLRWSAGSPQQAELVASWSIFRSTAPEGSKSGSWTQVHWVGDPATLTWTDSTVQHGHTATYSVQANLRDGGIGPTSNAVVTGRRPSPAPVPTVTGREQDVRLVWTAAVGATAYDIYRDGALAARLGAVTEWTDSTGYGHSHTYRVVPVNRWEQKHTTGTEEGRLPVGDPVGRAFTGGAARVASAERPGYSAPAAPTVTATPTTAAWTNVVARTFAGWTGAGPTTIGGISRDRGWVTEHATLHGTFTPLWAEATAAEQTHGARTAGATTRYRIRACNPSGCSPWSAETSALQRPPTPTACVATAATTRSMTVTVVPAAAEVTNAGYRLTSTHGAATGTGTQAGPTFSVDQLGHSTTHGYTVWAQNESPASGGWSDPRTCTGTTLELGVAVTGVSSSTRRIDATMSTVRGSSSTLTLEGISTHNNVASAFWDPLTHNSAFTVTASNTDGYNNVVAQASVSTKVLATPSAPTASISGGGEVPNGTATVSANGGSGTKQVRLGTGGTVYTAGSQSYSGLGAGSYYGYARAYNSDGHNTVFTGWDSAGPITVTAPPPAPSCLAGGSYYQNTAAGRTNLVAYPCAVKGVVRYGANVQYKSSEDGEIYPTGANYSSSLGWIDGTWGGHSDWVRIQMRSISATGAMSAYSGWFTVSERQ